jgi:flagellar basal body-associated protein FliL
MNLPLQIKNNQLIIILASLLVISLVIIIALVILYITKNKKNESKSVNATKNTELELDELDTLLWDDNEFTESKDPVINSIEALKVELIANGAMSISDLFKSNLNFL